MDFFWFNKMKCRSITSAKEYCPFTLHHYIYRLHGTYFGTETKVLPSARNIKITFSPTKRLGTWTWTLSNQVHWIYCPRKNGLFPLGKCSVYFACFTLGCPLPHKVWAPLSIETDTGKKETGKKGRRKASFPFTKLETHTLVIPWNRRNKHQPILENDQTFHWNRKQ